jgi:hypothetical protein
MKSSIIISALALAGSVLSSAVKFPDLAARMIDPATMDPTRLSVLSVLKTAIPTSPNSPMPTGDYEPAWYQALPQDVKSLLPALYPVVAVATSEVSVSQTPESAVAAVQSTFTDATMASSAVDSPAPTSTTSLAASSSASNSAISTPWTSQVTLTKTLQYASLPASSASASALPLYSGLVLNTTTQATGTGGVLPSASATSTNFLSAGAKTSIRTEILAAVAWVSVGAGFFLFG